MHARYLPIAMLPQHDMYAKGSAPIEGKKREKAIHCQTIEHAKMPHLHFLLNGKRWTESDAPPTMTVLDFLRGRARLTGTKEGCAEGDCGACTIVLGRLGEGDLHYQAVNSCLMMLPQIDHCAVLTVEGLAGPSGELHPVQRQRLPASAS